ncbi:MAG: EAL domain-containing protein [Desulfobulbaceae bacterium]|nr:EAL domain-containing protein [Desulfobulbaceae bacterium]
MSKPLREESPYLSKIIDVQKMTSELDLHLHKQIRGEIINIQGLIQLIGTIFSEVEVLAKQKVINENDLQYLKNFAKELKRLKVALIYYRQSRVYDSTSSATEELSEIIDESVTKINHNLNSIISIIRRQITKSDIRVLTGTQFIQKSLISFLAIIIIGSLTILYLFNKILVSNLNKLINGTIELGKGNLDWRLESKFNDEFSRLNFAFNNMASKIDDSKREISSKAEQIKQLAYYDSLTGLPNRNHFLEKLEQELARSKRNNEKLGILYIDLDNFKQVNDSFGHDIGDFLLRQVAKRLKKNTRISDTTARLAGDEFVIMLPQQNSHQDSSRVGQRSLEEISSPVTLCTRIIEELSRPFKVKNNVIAVSSSIGIAVYPENGSTAKEILNSADLAMYASKNEGKNRFNYCTEEMTTKMRHLIEIEHDIRHALTNREFVLQFQPQVELATNNIVALEALIRWNHPKHGFIAPADFIPIAEDRGIIQDISKWVIRDVFDHLKLWQEEGCKLIPVMVNLSGRDFFQQGIENFILEIIKKEEEFEGLLGIEVTETSIITDRENAITTLNNLRNNGVKIALDDFGTGYSSLNYLQLLPIDMVKIDRSFVKNIVQNSRDTAIIKAIVSMSHALNLQVVIEGIETPEQVNLIRNINCDLAQGFLFYKSLSAGEVCKLLKF